MFEFDVLHYFISNALSEIFLKMVLSSGVYLV